MIDMGNWLQKKAQWMMDHDGLEEGVTYRDCCCITVDSHKMIPVLGSSSESRQLLHIDPSIRACSSAAPR